MLSAAVLSAPARAHGGMYRGPWNAPPGVPAGPVTGAGPPGPGAPGPLTGARPSVSDGTSWQVWWEFAKDPLIARPDVPGATVVVSGSDEFFLGATGGGRGPAPEAVREKDRRDAIAAALARALVRSANRDIETACLIGLAKIGLDPPGARLVDLFASRLRDGDQEVRETAALALGISGQPAAFEVLADLVADSPAGRRLCGGEVPDRTRTFAAYGLGLLGRRADHRARSRAREVLLARLRDDTNKSRDLRVGAIEALGLLVPQGSAGLDTRLSWSLVEDLWSYFERDLGKGDELLQAHVPIAVARLLGRGTSSEHQRAKERLAGVLSGKQRRHSAVLQSAAMALGTISLPRETCSDDAAVADALVRYYEAGTDQLTRFFSVLSLGRIGGAANRSALFSIYRRSNRLIERPWAALSLGLVARRSRVSDRKVDEEIGKLLLRDFEEIESFDALSALALSLGLTGYEPAAPALEARLEVRIRDDTLIGYAAVGLALMDHASSSDRLLEVMKAATHRPFVLQQCALALGRLGDARVVPVLQRMLLESESTAVLAAVANALGQAGDRRSIEPLASALADRERPKLAQAFAAAALGAIGDKDPLPWNVPLAVGMNYMATVDTLTNGTSGVLDIL
ncbi:MAG: hypothetical protein Fur0037_01740 [Planctomycetota bacterium]